MSGFYSKEVKLENDESDGDGNGVDAFDVGFEGVIYRSRLPKILNN